MALVIDNPELEQAVQRLSEVTGQTPEASAYTAITEKLLRLEGPPKRAINWEAVRAIQDRVAKRPILSTESEDEILGYNEHGIFD